MKKEARSARRILTHTLTARPASKQASKQAKMYKTPGYSRAGTTFVEAKEFGDHVTAEHVVLHRDSKAD